MSTDDPKAEGDPHLGSPPQLGPDQAASAPLRWLGRAMRLLLVLVILAVGAGISYYWLANRPAAKRRPPRPAAVLVEVALVTPKTHRVVVPVMGMVVPARTIQLASRVSGEIVDVSPPFVPGGRFEAGKRILQIDPRDYRLAVQQRTSDLTKAQCDLRIEMGQQSVARREYELLSQDVQEEDKELILRNPQLAQAQAAVSAVQAALDKARLDMTRTDVAAPFNAMVQSRNVDLGSQVNVGTPLAALVGTDKYWIQVSVPVDQLKWIDIPGVSSSLGSTARVYHETAWGPKKFRAGTVERLMTGLEPQGRMARLLIAVEDPLDLKAPAAGRRPLILDLYTRVEIDGRELANVVEVPRTALRDGRSVWLMKPDGTLAIRDVRIIWSGNEHVYVTGGLADGDCLVTSDLGAPVEGMALRTAGQAASRPAKHLAAGTSSRKDPEAP